MKIHVAFEFESVEEMLATLGQRTNQVAQAITGTPAKGLSLVEDADEDEEEAPAPRKRVKKAAKKASPKKAPPADEDEEEEEEAPAPKKSAKKGSLTDLLDDDEDEDADDEQGEDADEEEEEEAPAPKKLDRVPQKTLDDVREACRAFAKKHGPEVLSDVLTEKYDIEALEDLKKSQYNDVIGTLLFYEKPKKGR